MKRWLITTLFTILLFYSMCLTVNAHSKEGSNGHDEYMSMIIFGSKAYKDTLNVSSDEYKALEALENAVALCVDQYQGSYENELKELNKMRIHGIPKSIESIDFTGNQHHRRYTHRGWDYIYTSGPASWDKETKGDWNNNWQTRKTILLQTVNKVFEFQKKAGEWRILWFEKDYGYEKQCKAFAELIYYVHILADIEASGINEGYSDMIKLALAHPQKENPDIYQELLTLLPSLFESQVGDTAYSGLITDIKLQAAGARSFVANNPDLTNCYSEYQSFATNLLKKLESKVPSLLRNEDFFKKVFC